MRRVSSRHGRRTTPASRRRSRSASDSRRKEMTMRHYILCLGIMTATFGQVHAADKLREPIQNYDNLEVTDFRNKIGENLSGAMVSDLQARVTEAVNASKLIAAVANPNLKFPKKDAADDTKLAWPGTGDDADARTLVLFSELITFNKGSRAKRYLIGGGTGRAELRGDCYLV